MTTQEELKSLLSYDPETGEFTWAVNRRKVRKGDKAGCVCRSTGYVRIVINYKPYSAHRLAWLYVYGIFPTSEIDHINRVRTDNKISNLRDVSRIENMNNIECKGYSYDAKRKKYEARYRHNQKLKFLGRYITAEEARQAYEREKRKHFA
jgi:hypothetical protein